ncbi:M48 family metallopeptidase [Streptomyces sp. NPDC058572]|uniref:M48 family metallopeptidase n=1 Tax=Streptomyces sp. NPDC058572 TaxID=3346546 RepID=UPI00366254E0
MREPVLGVPAGRRRRRRHPWELPMVWLCVVVTAAAAAVAAWRVMTGEAANLEFGILALPLMIYLLRGLHYARQRVNGVRITAEQFPEAHAMLTKATHAFGLRRVPDAYVVCGNGVLNAFANGHGSRRYVVFHSDLFEVGGRLRDPETFRFVLGHEIGHIAAGHVSYLRSVATGVAQQVPVLGSALSRAQEYTADNYGYALAPSGSRGMTVLAAGKYLYPQVDFDQMADRSRTERGFFVFAANALASHPVHVKRLAALRDRTRPGRMFF